MDIFYTDSHWITSTLSPTGSLSDCHLLDLFHNVTDRIYFTLSPTESNLHSHPINLVHTLTHWISFSLSPAGSLPHCHPLDIFNTVTHWICPTLLPNGSPPHVPHCVSFTLSPFHFECNTIDKKFIVISEYDTMQNKLNLKSVQSLFWHELSCVHFFYVPRPFRT